MVKLSQLVDQRAKFDQDGILKTPRPSGTPLKEGNSPYSSKFFGRKPTNRQ